MRVETQTITPLDEYKARIGRLEQELADLKRLADPLTRALYNEMSKRHAEVIKENASLENQLRVLQEKLRDSHLVREINN